jgi:transposase-like protein
VLGAVMVLLQAQACFGFDLDALDLEAAITTSEREQMKALEREVKELRKANEILKLASAFFAQAELDRRLKS